MAVDSRAEYWENVQIPARFDLIELLPAHLPKSTRFETKMDVIERSIATEQRLRLSQGFGDIAKFLAELGKLPLSPAVCPICARHFRRRRSPCVGRGAARAKTPLHRGTQDDGTRVKRSQNFGRDRDQNDRGQFQTRQVSWPFGRSALSTPGSTFKNPPIKATHSEGMKMNMHDSKTLKTTKKPAAAPRTKDESLGKATGLMRHGFSVLPLKMPAAGDAQSGKVPACTNGVKDATKSPKKFKKLVESLPNFNLGVATGKTSGIVVIDIDPRNGGNETLAALKRKLGPLPETVTVNTGGGGTHLYFEAPKKRLRSVAIGKGVDFLADGKYVVAPPSLHGSGGQYLWAKDASPRSMWSATLPRAWRNYIANPVREAASPKTGPGKNAIPEGNRNNELTRIAGHLRRAGLTEAEILDFLSAANKARCNPPLEPAEVSEIARNVAKYPVRDPAQLADAGEQLAQAVLDRHFDGGAKLRHEKDGQFWRWIGSHWAPIDDKVLQRLILETAKILPTKAHTKTLVHEAFALLIIQQSGEDDLLHINDDPPPVVNVANGELWLLDDGSVDFRPHDPKTGMRHVLPVAYDPSAECPEYDKALQQIFRDAENPGTVIRFMNGSGANGKRTAYLA